MDYTDSPESVVHTATGQRMHEDNQAIPTVVTDDDINAPTWELLEVIKAAGITPVKFNRDNPISYRQVLAAIKYFAWGVGKTSAPWSPASSFLSSKSTNGWQKLEGGLIIQWGTVGFAANNAPAVQSLVSFPIAFPTACVHISGVQTSRASYDGGGTWAMRPTNRTLANFVATLDNNGGNALYNFKLDQTAEWIAIGY